VTTLRQAKAAALQFVHRHRDGLVDLACRLVEAPSPNPPGDERAPARVARERLDDLGLHDTVIVGPRPERANLVCRHGAGGGRTLVLNGHLDTKPPGDLGAWDRDPYRAVVSGGTLFGLGAADMKGPCAALVYGLAAVAASGAELHGQALLALSADEEGEALDGVRYLVQDAGMRSDAVLVAEPCGVSEGWDAIPLISRGYCGVRVQVTGTRMHSSVSDRIPVVNASLQASRLLVWLHDNLRLSHPATELCPQGPTVTVGATLHGGEGLAFVPGSAEFTLDVRTLPGMSEERLGADLDAAIAEFLRLHPGGDITWTLLGGARAWTAATRIDAEHPLVLAVSAAALEVLGRVPPHGYFPGGTDAIWWQGWAGIPTLPAFGPGLLGNCHMPNERIEVDGLVQAAGIYATTVLEYLGEP
jgi:acetylornithine deacetylase/succinyl-diaminopimelate desuccinylase-like protein